VAPKHPWAPLQKREEGKQASLGSQAAPPGHPRRRATRLVASRRAPAQPNGRSHRRPPLGAPCWAPQHARHQTKPNQTNPSLTKPSLCNDPSAIGNPALGHPSAIIPEQLEILPWAIPQQWEILPWATPEQLEDGPRKLAEVQLSEPPSRNRRFGLVWCLACLRGTHLRYTLRLLPLVGQAGPRRRGPPEPRCG